MTLSSPRLALAPGGRRRLLGRAGLGLAVRGGARDLARPETAGLFSVPVSEDADMGAYSISGLSRARHFALLVGNYSRGGVQSPGARVPLRAGRGAEDLFLRPAAGSCRPPGTGR